MANCENITLRLATMDDSPLLLQWRNDQQTRRQSRSTLKVKQMEHLTWLNEALNDSTVRLFIVELEGQPAGTVRAKKNLDIWELSWTVAPFFRGKNIGFLAVKSLINQLTGTIRADVKMNNTASIRIAEKLGMQFDGMREEMTLWVLNR